MYGSAGPYAVRWHSCFRNLVMVMARGPQSGPLLLPLVQLQQARSSTDWCGGVSYHSVALPMVQLAMLCVCPCRRDSLSVQYDRLLTKGVASYAGAHTELAQIYVVSFALLGWLTTK